MKTRSIVWIVVVIIVIVIIAIAIGKKGPATPSQTASLPQQQAPAASVKVVPSTTAKPASSPSQVAVPVAQYYKVSVTNTSAQIYYSTSTVKDMIKVQNPTLNTSITSPVTIGGHARGSWYSAGGSAPIILTDANGRIIAQGSVAAQGNYATNDFVPFIATFPFPAQASNSTGVLVFRNANPSGLPQNDQSVEIVVKFK